MTKPAIDLKSLKQQLNQNREEDEFREKLEKHGGITKATSMLHYLFKGCQEHGRRSGWDALDELIEFMGYELGLYAFPLEYEMPADREKLWGKLRATVDFSILADYNDNLGMLTTAEELNWKEVGQFLTPKAIAQFMCQSTGIGKMHPGQRVLDPAVGFGVFLLEAMRIAPDGIGLYGVDIDRRACHATWIQLEINRRFNHRDVEYYVLRDDSLIPGRLAGTYVDNNGKAQKFSWHRKDLGWSDWSKANTW